MTNIPLTEQQLTDIENRAQAATAGPWCTDAWEIYQGSEYQPGLSMWIGETCRGGTSLEQDRADAAFVAAARTDVPALVAAVRRLQVQRKYLIGQLAKRDAETGRGDKALREFLAADPDGGEIVEQLTGTQQCGHDDYHDPHEWADKPGVWCPGHSFTDDKPAASTP
jgi:hypothetical protein